ncbi:MAG: low molecular weight protein arginine phosphatase, partial [Clostridia bacterium]|nr:low molecular weight protein arginine phosphatase [Clostridia bacterium]
MAFYNRFLFVCTGNTCRSPMAAALFRKMAADRGLPIVAVSAGLAAQSGSPASENAVKALAEEGIDLSRHLSKPVTRELCDEAQMIAVMSEHHRLALVAADVDPHKIFVLGGGVPDPYGGSLDVYRDTRDALKAVLPALLPPFRIVKMNESHIPALAVLEKECFSQPWSETGLSTELQNDTA